GSDSTGRGGAATTHDDGGEGDEDAGGNGNADQIVRRSSTHKRFPRPFAVVHSNDDAKILPQNTSTAVSHDRMRVRSRPKKKLHPSHAHPNASSSAATIIAAAASDIFNSANASIDSDP